MKQHLPCPLEGCDSSDAYTEYNDGHGWCFSCNKGKFPNKIRPEEYERTIVDGFRGIPARVCEKLGIWSYVDEAGNVIFREYEGPTHSKFRRVHDKQFWVKGVCPSLGGTHLFNAGSSHYITVVEGEEDWASAYYILNQGKTLNPVVYLTSAGIAHKHREDVYNYLSKFETVKLAIEDDKAGKEVKELLCQMLPNKVREVSLTKHKDANDYLTSGDSNEFKQAWNNAAIFTPDNIYHTEADVLAVLENDEMESYFQTPFPDLNDVIRGIPLNHVTLITGMEGLGKTELLRALEYKALSEDVAIGVLHHEETKKTLYNGLACYELGKNARDPDKPLPIKEVLGAVKDATGEFKNLFVFEFKRDPTVDEVLEQLNYLVYVCGVRYVFIDPINQFDPVDGEQSKVDYLDTLSKKVEKYVANNPLGVVWTAHVNDEGQTRNSRMISKACSLRINLDRDLLSDNDARRNTTTISVAKNRPFATTGKAGVAYFNPGTFTLEQGTHLPEEGVEDVIPF
jgi:twinkle protein